MTDATAIRRAWAERVSAARKAAGLTQMQLAARAGIDPSYVSRIENARLTPGLEIQLGLAAALAVPHAELFAVEAAA